MNEACRSVTTDDGLLGSWPDWFPLHYAAVSQKNSARRRSRGKAQKARQAQSGAPSPTSGQLAYRDFAISGKQSRQAAITKRLTIGHCWHGGGVGGNPRYARAPSIHPGLVSEEAPILQLFVTKLPRARRLRAGHTKQRLDETDSKLLALDCAYVVSKAPMRRVGSNGDMRGVLRVEIDAPLSSWATIPAACQAANLPLPNIAVGYVDAHGRVLNPHLLWVLEHSVAFIGKSTPPQRLFNGVLRGLTAALIPFGADPGGLSNAQRMKNPVSPLWDRQVFADTPYSLTDLGSQIDLNVNPVTLQARGSAGQPFIPDHPDPRIAAESNRLFRALALWARQEVDRFRGAGGPYEPFQDAVEDEAQRLCCLLGSDNRKKEQTAGTTAQSVARWTWLNYHRRPSELRPKLAADELQMRQAAGGRTTAAGKRTATEAAIQTVVLRLATASAARPSQPALAAATGLSERTIRRHWPFITALVAAITPAPQNIPTPATRSLLVKKLTYVEDTSKQSKDNLNTNNYHRDTDRNDPSCLEPAETRSPDRLRPGSQLARSSPAPQARLDPAPRRDRGELHHPPISQPTPQLPPGPANQVNSPAITAEPTPSPTNGCPLHREATGVAHLRNEVPSLR
jgi:hypothetical protein